MKPEAKHFTRDNPCTKLDIWNAFRGRRGFIRPQVDTAHAIIGLNAPRYMIASGYLECHDINGVERYVLTAIGINWLMTKFKSYLNNHPLDRSKAKNLPKGF